MCGIVGIVTPAGRSPSATDADLVRMRDTLTRRGPDDAGLWRHGPIAFGHRRLAILDPEHGRQPWVATADDDAPVAAVTYNGEIYNHLELRREPELRSHGFATRCDTETLVAAYRVWGDSLLTRLRGMFAFALYDAVEHRLVLARDPLGVKPLYYALVDAPGGPELVFASEPVAILAHPHATTQPDWIAVSAYLSTIRTTMGRRTLFDGIRTLMPGEVLTCDLAREELRPTIATYWQEREEPEAMTFDDAVQRTRAVMGASIEAHLLSDVPTCALLSGGLDSTITAGIAARHVDPLRTYCAGATDESESDDFSYARMAATEIGSIHTEVPVDRRLFAESWPRMVGELGVPLSTPNEVAIHAVADALRSHAKVTISGEGADEFFAGYGPPLAAVDAYLGDVASGSPTTPAMFYLGANSWIPIHAKGELLREPILAAIDADQELVQTMTEAFDAAGDGRRSREAHLRVQRRINLTGLLGRLDTATMLASVEGRTPFSDRIVADLAASLPMEHKYAPDAVDGLTTKRALRAAFADLTPEPIRTRPKASFPLPFQGWLEDQASVLLTSPSAQEVFEPGLLAVLATRAGANWMIGWPVINIALWLRRWWD
jgi:asparagine synthase (glutamine-hydrolysing)